MQAQRREVYLDHAAATPLAPEVWEAMEPYLKERFFNPSAPYAPARRVHVELEQARTTVARLLGARPDNVTFTAGATEANNLALASCDGHVVTTQIEHESILACVAGGDTTLVATGPNGLIDPQAVAAALQPSTQLVSIALANGEVGSIQPMRAIAQVVARERMRRLEAHDPTPLLLHTDASQAAGYTSLNVSTLGVDLMTLSAAKIYGPKQMGLLWHADGVALRPLVQGGGQEGGLRSGTENVAGAAGMARALELAERMRAGETRRLRSLSRVLRKRLQSAVPSAVFTGPTREGDRLPGLVHVSFPGVEARRLVVLLERAGVYVGTGSACAASRMRVSHVLSALGIPEEVARGSLRITMGRETTVEDVDYAVDAIASSVHSELDRAAHGEHE